MMRMDKNKPSILEQSVAELLESEREEYIDTLPEFEREYDLFDQRRKEIMEQMNLVGLEFVNGHILEEYGLQRLNDLSEDRQENNRQEVRFLYDFFSKVFGFERAEEILRNLYQRMEISPSEDLKKLGAPKETIKGHHKKINSYLDDIFVGKA